MQSPGGYMEDYQCISIETRDTALFLVTFCSLLLATLQFAVWEGAKGQGISNLTSRSLCNCIVDGFSNVYMRISMHVYHKIINFCLADQVFVS